MFFLCVYLGRLFMRVLAVTLALLLSLSAGQAIAAKSDIMPAPHKAPRVPVQQLTLYEASDKYTPPPKPAAAKPPIVKASAPHQDIKGETVKDTLLKDKASKSLKDAKELEGMAKALDGERLLVGEKEIRLFGIVTPSIASNYGPQARQKLDAIVKGGAVLCKITDKDRDGRPIAFCGTVDTPDLSYEMLRQGWAMVDRKALKNNSLAEVYEKVEQQAQAQNKGLFAPMPMVTSIPLSNPSNSLTVPLVSTPTTSIAKDTASETVKPEQPKAETTKQDVIKTDIPGTALSIVQPVDSKLAQSSYAPAVAKNEPAKSEPAAVSAKEPSEKITQAQPAQTGGSFFERYQAIVGGILWIVGAFAFGGAMVVRDRLQQIEKRKALAAALNGELTSARHICRTRARELTRRRHLGEDDAHLRPSQLWPRIRALVYQAHVSSIGLLGSDLARRVASIYGQCADYAVYYQQTGMQRLPTGAAVSETLTNLADHIDSILDGLAYVEQTGKAFVAGTYDDAAVNETIEVEQQEQSEQQARNSVNEEARLIKERFERMATSMVDMLGRKREAVNSVEAVASDTAQITSVEHQAKVADAHAHDENPPSQAA